jgi:hypothetical protein
VVWDEKAINERRLEVLQRDGATRYSDQGVNLDLGICTGLGCDLEELAPTIPTDVERQQARSAQTTHWSIHDLEPCADPSELLVEQ